MSLSETDRKEFESLMSLLESGDLEPTEDDQELNPKTNTQAESGQDPD